MRTEIKVYLGREKMICEFFFYCIIFDKKRESFNIVFKTKKFLKKKGIKEFEQVSTCFIFLPHVDDDSCKIHWNS